MRLRTILILDALFGLFHYLVVMPMLITFFAGLLWPAFGPDEKDICKAERYVTKYSFWEVGCYVTDMAFSKIEVKK